MRTTCKLTALFWIDWLIVSCYYEVSSSSNNPGLFYLRLVKGVTYAVIPLRGLPLSETISLCLYERTKITEATSNSPSASTEDKFPDFNSKWIEHSLAYKWLDVVVDPSLTGIIMWGVAMMCCTLSEETLQSSLPLCIMLRLCVSWSSCTEGRRKDGMNSTTDWCHIDHHQLQSVTLPRIRGIPPSAVILAPRFLLADSWALE